MQLIASNGVLTRRPDPKAVTPADPYAPIEKRPLVTHDGMRSKAFTVRLKDDDAPSGWREVGTVSADYLLVSNRDVRDMAEEIALRTGFAFQTARVLFDGRRFTLAIAFPTALTAEVRVGDPVSVGLMFENSYDGSRRLGVSLYVHRLACSNGMIAPQLFGRVRFKHDRSAEGWEDEVRRVLSALSQAEHGLKEFARSAAVLASKHLTANHLRALRKGPLAGLPLTLWARIVDRVLIGEEHTLWGLTNAGTWATWWDPKMTVRDVEHNETFVKGMLGYARTLG